MYFVDNRTVKFITELFVRLRLWHNGDEATDSETRIKLFYSIYAYLLPISLIVGAVSSDNSDESIFLAEAAVISTVMSDRLLHIIWKKKETIAQLHRICINNIEDQKQFNLVHDKLKRFMNIMNVFYISSVLMGIALLLVVPFVGSERKLFFNIGFPLDYKKNEKSYWIAFAFIFTEIILCLISMLFSILKWYLLLSCGLRYEVLGNKLRNMGVDGASHKRKISEVEKQNLFGRDIIAHIKTHKDINRSRHHDQLNTFLSNIFSVQLATSATCICCSVYCLAFNNNENIVEFIIYLFILFYNIFDIFMVMYFGNEINLSSDRLAYCLFESNWIDQTERSKKFIIIFGECLKQPQQMVILKIYPLTLETFTRILNSAYSMFNILKNVK